MKDIYKNPALYYVLVPAAAALWPLLVWAVSLPNAERRWTAEKTQYDKGRNIIEEILTLDPERMDFTAGQDSEREFDYAAAVERVASLCGIPSAGYRLSSGIIMTAAGQKSQSANVILKDVDITKFANFLSTIQLRWANLQCTKVKLTKKKGLPDAWDVDIGFKYFY